MHVRASTRVTETLSTQLVVQTKTRHGAGISLKTQELFLIVFCCRYLDLFFRFISLYNSVMKVLYIGSTAAMVHMIRCKEPYKSTYDRTQDSFRLEFAVVPCAVLALLTNLVRGFGFVEVRACLPACLPACLRSAKVFGFVRFEDMGLMGSGCCAGEDVFWAIYPSSSIYTAQIGPRACSQTKHIIPNRPTHSCYGRSRSTWRRWPSSRS
jgi:hypothetical protein